MAIVYDSYVSPQALTAFARSVPVNQNFILNQILPDRYAEILEVEFADTVVTTRTAHARAWDAPPLPGKRDLFSTRKVKLPAISQMMGTGERDRLEMERLRAGGQATLAIEQAIYDDAENNVRSVQARVELMRGDLLNDGKITISEMGGLEADFQVPGAHIVTAATPWTTIATADVLGDIRAWNKVYRATNGFSFGGMVLSEDILYTMLQNQVIRDMWSSVTGRPSVVTLEQLNQTLVANRLPTVLFTYDAQVVVDDVVTTILPADKVTFVPPTGIELGFTQWGMTATALELQGAGVQVQPSPAGIVAVLDKDVRPPFRQSTYVDATCMPILSRPSGLFVADVA
jgi:Phage major capsid protein E